MSPPVLSPATVAAALAAAAAVGLLLPGRRVAVRAPGEADGARSAANGMGSLRARWSGPAGAIVSGAVATSLLVEVPGRTTALAVVAAAAVLAAAALVRRRRRRVGRRVVADRVQECCDLLAADLAAGLPPGAALTRAAVDWPALAPAARAGELGGDVPDALRGVATLPGAGDLTRLAAAWQVSQRTGQGLAEPVARTAGALRRARATRRVVDSELASARATARLLAGLPLLALLMGSGAGGDPWRFLLATPAGLGCLATGLALALLGLAWIERIADAVEAAA